MMMTHFEAKLIDSKESEPNVSGVNFVCFPSRNDLDVQHLSMPTSYDQNLTLSNNVAIRGARGIS